MFRVISISGFAIVVASIALHFALSAPKRDELFGKERRWRILDGLRVLVLLLTLLLVEQKSNFFGVLRKLVYLLAVVCFLVLAVTGFVPAVIMGKTISGFWLMIHATFAPVFAICLTILAVMWANNCRLDKKYLPWLHRLLQREAAGGEAGETSELVRKICFWLIIALALPLMLSVVTSMFPIFGTHGQEILLNIHRYSALLFALAAILYTYLLVRAKMQQ